MMRIESEGDIGSRGRSQCQQRPCCQQQSTQLTLRSLRIERRLCKLPSGRPINIAHKKAASRLRQLAATLNRSQQDWGVEGERSIVDQPRVTTGGGALPFPTGALPTHPLTPMARTIEQTAIRNFFMELPMLPRSLYCRQIPLWLYFGNTLTASYYGAS